ncbi:T9SS type A sorting domain-containing protein [Polaribacter septentrionalilitoris]|uniref:T9SS type A sorting domain-containing protein n=1 Tax=Polaribacter septentrionalilitoris TaxID=2494657 RepID=UPI00135AB80D|nr:T9SS type A sorting domain-containing protein [Polaribacter septentrionalilitoris]
MKTKLLLFTFFLTFVTTKAQLVLLDEPQSEGIGTVYSLAVYDNDILYTMVKNNTTLLPGVFLSNGVPGEKIELLPGSTARAYFSTNVSGDAVRLYKDGNYTTTKAIYAGVVNTGALNQVYKLNNSRSLLIPENTFKPTVSNFNMQLVTNDGLVTIDTIQENLINKLVVRHFKKDGNQVNFTLPESFYGENSPNSFFKWNDKLFFRAQVSGELDLYEVDALGTRRVTQNKVSKPTSFKGVSPKSFLLDDYIYFIGRDGFYTNVVPGPVERNYPVNICFSNGDIDFGSTETAINNGDDGSLGYKSFSDADSPDNILGKINEKIIYFKQDGFSKKFYSIPNLEDLEIDAPQIDVFQYVQYQKKLYVFPKVGFGFYEDLFISDGTKSGTRKMFIPRYIATSTPAKNIGKIVPVGDRLYFLAEYSLSEKKHLLLAYDINEDSIKLVYQFPNDVKPNVNFLYPYNNGFIVRSRETINSEEKIYTLNAEIRAKIFNNSGSKTTRKNNTTFTYNSKTYHVDANSITFNENDQLKVQLLDTLSNQFKGNIINLPNNENKARISSLFYAVNTLKENNTFSASLTLGFDDDMIENINLTGDNITILAYDNNNWTEITPQSFNNNSKTVTINVSDFTSEVFFFVKYNGVLSTGISAIIKDNFSIYPNPATSFINIKSKSIDQEIQSVEVFNLLGKKVIHQKNKTFNTILNTSSLSKGIYFIKLKTKSQQFTKKIIIE